LSDNRKPCEWNKQSKTSKTCKTVDEIKFKRIKYVNDKKKRYLKMLTEN